MLNHSPLDTRKPKAILLDMDDTIILDDPLSERSWRLACNKFAYLVAPGISPDELYAVVHRVSSEYWKDQEQHPEGRLRLTEARREIVCLAFAELGLNSFQAANELADNYSMEKEKAICPVPGAIEVIQRFKSEGLRLGLITNGGTEIQRRKIRRFGLERLFDHILIEGEFGVGKPDERVFRNVIDKLGVTSSEAWMVGDDLQRDIGGAQSVGIFGVWVDWRGSGLSSSSPIKPGRIIRSIAEL